MKSNRERLIGILIGIKLMASQDEASDENISIVMGLVMMIILEFFPDVSLGERDGLIEDSDIFIKKVIKLVENKKKEYMEKVSHTVKH